MEKIREIVSDRENGMDLELFSEGGRYQVCATEHDGCARLSTVLEDEAEAHLVFEKAASAIEREGRTSPRSSASDAKEAQARRIRKATRLRFAIDLSEAMRSSLPPAARDRSNGAKRQNSE